MMTLVLQFYKKMIKLQKVNLTIMSKSIQLLATEHYFPQQIKRLFHPHNPSQQLTFYMNTDLSRHQLFHSSIITNSINLNRNYQEEIDFFGFQIVPERNSSEEIQKTQVIKPIAEDESAHCGSLLDKILFTTQNHPEIHSGQSEYWLSLGDQPGCSQSESDQIQKVCTKKVSIRVKEKFCTKGRSKIYLCHQSDEQEEKKQILSKRFQNETKNIPKNFGKAIIAYSLKNFKKFQHLKQFKSISFPDFKKQLVLKRKSINSISGLKSLWMDFKYASSMRLLSNQFLRRHSLSYIFNSRISNISPHVKYRYKLIDAIKKPMEFSYIKEY